MLPFTSLFRQSVLSVQRVTKIVVPAPCPCVRNKTSIPVPEKEIHVVGQHRASQPGFGKIYDKKPFKFRCIEGKTYFWCACGHSKTQPFCDSTHANRQMRITMRPVPFIAPETKDYWFCNCKQTSKRPFCDGTHRREDVVSAIRV